MRSGEYIAILVKRFAVRCGIVEKPAYCFSSRFSSLFADWKPFAVVGPGIVGPEAKSLRELGPL